MKKIVFVTCVFMYCYISLFAQQDPQFTQYNSVPLLYNGAFAGSNGKMRFSLAGRARLLAFQGDPRSLYAAYDQYVKKIKGGIGAVVIYDELGLEQNYSAALIYAPKFKIINKKLSISPSIKIRYGRKSLTTGFAASGISLTLTSTSEVSASYTDASLGLLANTEKYYVGFSVEHLLGTKTHFVGIDNLTFSPVRYFYFVGGYTYQQAQSKLTITPSILLKSDARTVLLMASLAAKYKYFLTGVQYHVGDAFAIMAGLEFSPLRIGYSYAIPISSLRPYFYGNHELSLRFLIK